MSEMAGIFGLLPWYVRGRPPVWSGRLRRCLLHRFPFVTLMPGDVFLERDSALFRALLGRFGGVVQSVVFVLRYPGGTSVLHYRFGVQAGRRRERIR